MSSFTAPSLILASLLSSVFLFGAAPPSASEPTGETCVPASRPSITPILKRSYLTAGARRVAPTRSALRVLGEINVGDSRIRLNGDTASAVDQCSEKTRWMAKTPDGRSLRWISTEKSTGYLMGLFANQCRWPPPVPDPPQVRRLKLDTGAWLSPLDLTAAAATQPSQRWEIESVLERADCVLVLTAIFKNGPHSFPTPAAESHRLTCFRSADAGVVWSRQFPAAGPVASPGAFLLFAEGPTQARPGVRMLTLMGDDVLVCPGPLDDIRCLAGASGMEKWSLGRVWEYRRNFIGPSVWRHDLSRCGAKAYGGDSPHDLSGHGTELERPFACKLVGGPAVVRDGGNAQPGDGFRIFVAVAEALGHEFTNYVSDCTLYEISTAGQPIAIGRMPQLVRGSEFSVRDDGVVWACENASLVKLRPSANGHDGGRMFGGGLDCTTHVEWFRQFEKHDVGAWLTTETAGDPVSIGERMVFRVTQGGYVIDAAKPVFEFPISMLDLKNGAVNDLVLHVPYRGTLELPECNYSSRTLPSGVRQTSTMGAYKLAITSLSAVDKRFSITLGMDGDAALIEFDLKQVEGG